MTLNGNHSKQEATTTSPNSTATDSMPTASSKLISLTYDTNMNCDGLKTNPIVQILTVTTDKWKERGGPVNTIIHT